MSDNKAWTAGRGQKEYNEIHSYTASLITGQEPHVIRQKLNDVFSYIACPIHFTIQSQLRKCYFGWKNISRLFAFLKNTDSFIHIYWQVNQKRMGIYT